MWGFSEQSFIYTVIPSHSQFPGTLFRTGALIIGGRFNPSASLSLWAQSLSCAWFFVTSRAIAQQIPLSMEFSKQEHWSGLLFPSPRDLPNPGIEAAISCTGRWILYLCATWEAQFISWVLKNKVSVVEKTKPDAMVWSKAVSLDYHDAKL